jgi:cytoplasmic iron level regulating protein YaaA (DUF328/UPF0246 family)
MEFVKLSIIYNKDLLLDFRNKLQDIASEQLANFWQSCLNNALENISSVEFLIIKFWICSLFETSMAVAVKVLLSNYIETFSVEC